jgi:hypothetical protein
MYYVSEITLARKMKNYLDFNFYQYAQHLGPSDKIYLSDLLITSRDFNLTTLVGLEFDEFVESNCCTLDFEKRNAEKKSNTIHVGTPNIFQSPVPVEIVFFYLL